MAAGAAEEQPGGDSDGGRGWRGHASLTRAQRLAERILVCRDPNRACLLAAGCRPSASSVSI